MTTALSIINRATELIGYKDASEALSGDDSGSFLGVLNSLVDSWATNSMYVYAVTEIVQSVTGNAITIGSGATINTVRPVRIPAGGFVRVGGTDYGFDVVTREQYESTSQKASTSSTPCCLYYEASLPTGKLYFYPAISGTVELHLPIEQRLTAFADLATDYTLAPGYRAALEYTLGEELGISHGSPSRLPAIIRMASNKRRAIETFEPPMLTTGFDQASGNILNGWQ